MKINAITNQNTTPSFKGIYNNKLLLKSLKFAADNGTLFSARVTLGLSLLARPAAIALTPKTDRENKKYACSKSFASSITSYLIMFAASKPIADAVEKIDKLPSKFLKKSTIKNLKGTSSQLQTSKSYSFVTQLFKLGSGLVIAIPKSILTCALIPPLMLGLNKILSPKKKTPEAVTSVEKPISTAKTKANVISFKGIYNSATEMIAKGIGKIIDKKPLQEASKKLQDTNFAQHIMSLTDVLLTLTFVQQTAKSKKIKENRKKPLIYNSLISTGLCLTGGYAANYALSKPTEKFIKKFKAINKDLPNLEKYVEGIKIAKPVLILGGIYYIFIPLIATFISDKTGATKDKKLSPDKP